MFVLNFVKHMKFLFTSCVFPLQEDDFKRTMEDSAKLQRAYDKYFDLVIINNDLNDTYHEIMEAIDRLSTEPQWVPVTWVY